MGMILNGHFEILTHQNESKSKALFILLGS